MRIIAVPILVVLALAPPAKPQDTTQSTAPFVYKVEFTIHDGGNAAVANSRRYSMLVIPNNKNNFYVGDKVPYSTGSGSQGQYQYLDTGVHIMCLIGEMNDKVSLKAEIELSTVVPPEKRLASNVPNPTINQTHISVNSAVTPGKPTLIASIDDPGTARKYDVDATVSKVN